MDTAFMSFDKVINKKLPRLQKLSGGSTNESYNRKFTKRENSRISAVKFIGVDFAEPI